MEGSCLDYLDYLDYLVLLYSLSVYYTILLVLLVGYTYTLLRDQWLRIAALHGHYIYGWGTYLSYITIEGPSLRTGRCYSLRWLSYS